MVNCLVLSVSVCSLSSDLTDGGGVSGFTIGGWRREWWRRWMGVWSRTSATEESLDLCLVGCFLTATSVNFQSMKMVLAKLWHPLGGVTIIDIRDTRVYFLILLWKRFWQEFPRDPHGRSITNLLVFASLQDGKNPLEVPLSKTTFWVQIHNL